VSSRQQEESRNLLDHEKEAIEGAEAQAKGRVSEPFGAAAKFSPVSVVEGAEFTMFSP
jgi:hypothetical protein